jgi:hypothetical protein
MGCSTTATTWKAIFKRRAVAIALAVAAVAAILALPFWLVFLIPSLPVCLAVWFLGRKRVQWNKLDFLVLLAPYLAWMALGFVPNIPKSLSNAAVELFCLGLAVDLAPVIRLILPKGWNGKIIAATLLTLACAVAVGIYFTVPCLPE